MTQTPALAPTHTGGSHDVDRFIRALGAEMCRRDLLPALDEKTLARLTVAVSAAFGDMSLSALPARCATPAEEWGSYDTADDPNERHAVELADNETEARVDAASWAGGRPAYRYVLHGPWRPAD